MLYNCKYTVDSNKPPGARDRGRQKVPAWLSQAPVAGMKDL